MSDTQRARVIATPGSGARSINRVPTYAGLTELGMMFGARRQVSAGKAISESKLCSLPRKEDERDQATALQPTNLLHARNEEWHARGQSVPPLSSRYLPVLCCLISYQPGTYFLANQAVPYRPVL